MTSRGPGYRRMMERFGPERAEALRQQVLREQETALAEATKSRPPAERDRDTYRDYPPPKRRGR